ncbi:MAG: hypothetical protein V9E83_08135 [Baekduia sp.]
MSEESGARKRPTSEERNALVRADIEPLAPDERPPALIVAALVCVLLAAGNLITMAAGVEVSGEQNPVGRSVVLAFALSLLAGGIWSRSPVALLIFQALLIVTILFGFFGILSAANAAALIASTLVMLLAGTLFWKLIRVLARIQAPERI